MTLNFRVFFLYFPSAGIIVMFHPDLFIVYEILRLLLGTFCALDIAFDIWVIALTPYHLSSIKLLFMKSYMNFYAFQIIFHLFAMLESKPRYYVC